MYKTLKIIKLSGQVLSRVNSFNYLGIYVDDKLKFNHHVDHLKARLSQFCGITFRLRRNFNAASAKALYYSCVFSLITYCITVWGGVLGCGSRGNELQKLHNRIIKNLFHHHSNSTNQCLFKEKKILKLKDLHTYFAAIYMFKVVKMNVCPSLQSDLDLQIIEHSYSTRGSGTYVVPFPRVECIKINYKYQFVCSWKNLPTELKNTTTLSV